MLQKVTYGHYQFSSFFYLTDFCLVKKYGRNNRNHKEICKWNTISGPWLSSAKEIEQLYIKSSIQSQTTCGFPDVIGHETLSNILKAKEDVRYIATLKVSYIATPQEASPVSIFHLP